MALGFVRPADPDDADALSQDLNDVATEIAALGYERRSSYEQFAPAQLAFENAKDAVDTLRAKSRATTKVELGEGAPRYGARSGAS